MCLCLCVNVCAYMMTHSFQSFFLPELADLLLPPALWLILSRKSITLKWFKYTKRINVCFGQAIQSLTKAHTELFLLKHIFVLIILCSFPYLEQAENTFLKPPHIRYYHCLTALYE